MSSLKSWPVYILSFFVGSILTTYAFGEGLMSPDMGRPIALLVAMLFLTALYSFVAVKFMKVRPLLVVLSTSSPAIILTLFGVLQINTLSDIPALTISHLNFAMLPFGLKFLTASGLGAFLGFKLRRV